MFLELPIPIQKSPRRHPTDYYIRRLREGIRAFRDGVRDTPLTRALECWDGHRIVQAVGGYEVPGAWDTYARILREYLDAVDAEDDLAPYRFQKVGESWAVQFSVGGVIKSGYFKDHRGLRHYAQLLASPHRVVESVHLAGRADPQTLSLIESEKSARVSVRHDPEAIQTYRDALELLADQHAAAKLRGDLVTMEEVEEKIERLRAELWPGRAGGGTPNFRTLERQPVGKPGTALTIHKAVGTALRRAIQTLIDGKMVEVANFLEMTVIPEGYAFAYRPLQPEPHWLL